MDGLLLLPCQTGQGHQDTKGFRQVSFGVFLLRKGTEYKWETPNEGPFQILEAFDNGTVAIQKGAVRDTVNIRRIFPFHEKAK